MEDGFLERMLRETRNEAGKSQEFMSLELGVARKTIQNWESGFSEPSVGQVLQWFSILNISPFPYLIQYVYPKMEKISNKDDLKKLREALITIVMDLPDEGVRELLYLFYGDHGSSPRAVLNMMTAHLQTPMRDRVTAGSVILKNYEIALKKDMLTGKNHIQPDVELLRNAIEMGEAAAVKDVDTYVHLQ